MPKSLFNQDGLSRRDTKRKHVKGTTEGQKSTQYFLLLLQVQSIRGPLA